MTEETGVWLMETVDGLADRDCVVLADEIAVVEVEE